LHGTLQVLTSVSMGCVFAIGVSWLKNVSLWLHSLSLVFLTGNALRSAAFIRFGSLFFAVPLAIFGMRHFALQVAVVTAVPSWMPGHLFWVWLVGTALIVASLSITTGKMAHLAGLLAGIMLFLFVLMNYIPNAARNPSDQFHLAFY